MDVMQIEPNLRENPQNSTTIISFPTDEAQTAPKPKPQKEGLVKDVKSNKKKGVKSEVYPFQIEDAQKIVQYFKDNEMWLHFLVFTFSCNMARRITDTLSLQWKHLFNPETGNIRNDLLEISEQKTGKLANPRINSACRSAIKTYVEKTGCDPSADDYQRPVFLQLSGTHKGSVITDAGYRKALKKAAKAVGIEYNVGTHSTRKMFGMLNRMLHPNDYDSMEILRTILNHSDSKTTERYIGLTKQKVDKYYDDMGTLFEDYIVGGKKYNFVSSPIVSIDTNDLRDIIKLAYEAGRDNANNQDAMRHVDAITEIMEIVESLVK